MDKQSEQIQIISHLFIDGKFVLLESTQYPNQLIGLFPDGRVKPPNEVTPDEGRFVPLVHQYVSCGNLY